MKIESIHIDGFGLFNQLSIEDLQSGLTIFKGSNETGKSTLLSFIRYMLFDFNGARTASKLYPPLSGGNHGGRLVITTDSEQRCIIERYAGKKNNVKITFKNGQTRASAELSKMLGYVDKDIFENIYAFGLDELQRFESLNNENIRSSLYSAGTGIGKVSIYGVKKHIKSLEEELYKKRGRKPQINQLVGEIKDIDRQISEIKNDQARYDSLQAEKQIKSKIINQLKDERSDIQKKLNYIQNIISVWDDWRNLQEALTTLSDLPKINDFPEKGVNNLDRILEKKEDVREIISLLHNKLESNRLAQARTLVDEELLSQRDTIVDLGNGIEKYRSEKDLLSEQKHMLDIERSAFLDLLSELGPQWDEAMLNRFDRSIPAKETVIQKRKLIDETSDCIDKIQIHLTQRTHDIEQINDEINKIDEKLHSSTIKITGEELNQRYEALRNLRTKYPALKEKESELKSIQKEEAFFSAIQPVTMKTVQQAPAWPAAVMVLIGITGIIYGYFSNAIYFGIVIFILLLASTAAYYISIKKKSPVSAKDTGSSSGVLQDDIKDSADFSDRKHQIIEEITSLKEVMLNHAVLCGFDDIPEPVLLEQRDKELQDTAYALKDISGLNDEHHQLLERKKELVKSSAELEQSLNSKQKELSILSDKWKEWLITYDLDPALSAESILEIFSMIKASYEKQKTIHTLENRINSIDSSIHTYEERIRTLVEQCGRIPSGLSPDTDIQKLRSDAEDALNAANELIQLGIAHEELKMDLHNANIKFDNLNEELCDLLRSGHSDNEDEFRKNARIWQQRLDLQSEIQNANKQIRKISGDGELYNNFIADLKKADILELKTNEDKLKQRLGELDEELSYNLDKRGAIHNQIDQLEHSEEGSLLRMRREGLNEHLHNISREWAALVLAQEILTKAIEIYEKERQPAVIIEAQSFFTKITAGRYKRIYSPLDSMDIFVEDRDDKTKSIAQLSKGTAEQLYLALRFGYIREFGKHSEVIPIVFDEILVNFDPVRSKNAGNAILELAATNQVLYFTCHPETVKILTEAAPEAQVIDMDDYHKYNESSIFFKKSY